MLGTSHQIGLQDVEILRDPSPARDAAFRPSAVTVDAPL